MFVHVSSRPFMSGQTDDRINLPLPMVYEQIPVELPKWEYRVLSVDTREEALPDAALLNELGEEGWSLVGVMEEKKASGNGSIVHYYFIRQKM